MTQEAPSGSTASAPLRWAPAIIIVLVGALSLLGRAFFFEGPEFVEDDWRAAAKSARALAEADDLVRAYPVWDERALVHLSGFDGGLSMQRDAVLEDFSHAPAVWVFAHASEIDEALEDMPFEPVERERVEEGSVVGVRVQPPEAERAKVRLFEALEGAKVEVVGADGKVTACGSWDAKREAWMCPGRDRVYNVGRTIREMDDEVRECIWMPAPKGRARWRVTFPQVALGSKLVVRASNTNRGWRLEREGHYDFVVRSGEEVVIDEKVPAADHHWTARVVETSAGAKDVVFELSAKTHQHRAFCFDGWVY